MLDIWTKSLVSRHIPLFGEWLPQNLSQFLPYFRVVHLHNRGTAFSLFAETDQINLIVSILAAIVSVMIVLIYPRIDPDDKALRAALTLQLGGTVGNLISRIEYGHVVDFISIGDFAVFNLADASLVIGAGVMLLAVLREEFEHRKEKQQPEDPTDPSKKLPPHTSEGENV